MPNFFTRLTNQLSRIPPLRKLVRLGHTKQDSLRIQDMKSMSTVILLGVMAVTVSYFLIPGRSPFLQTFDFVALALEFYGLAVLWRSRNVQTLFRWFVPPYLTLMGLFVLLNGTKEGDILGFIVVPCAAVVILGPNRSIPWFLICLAAMIALPQIDPILPELTLASAISPSNPDGLVFQSPWKKPLGPVEGIAIAAVVFFIYFLFRSAYLQLDRAKHDVEAEKSKVDRLMHSVFPSAIATRLTEDNTTVIAEHIPDATILFADIVAFTPLASSLPADRVVGQLDAIFSRFDNLCAKHGVEKIKTIGDAYMAATGLLGDQPDHAERMAAFALEMQADIATIPRDAEQMFSLRIGLHSGPVVAGVIGKSKPFYDVWGETVNTAARLESQGTPGKIQVTHTTRSRLAPGHRFSSPHSVALKGIGQIKAHFLLA